MAGWAGLQSLPGVVPLSPQVFLSATHMALPSVKHQAQPALFSCFMGQKMCVFTQCSHTRIPSSSDGLCCTPRQSPACLLTSSFAPVVPSIWNLWPASHQPHLGLSAQSSVQVSLPPGSPPYCTHSSPPQVPQTPLTRSLWLLLS
jgi:hypothetical protein